MIIITIVIISSSSIITTITTIALKSSARPSWRATPASAPSTGLG